jgi:hypothetical protein
MSSISYRDLSALPAEQRQALVDSEAGEVIRYDSGDETRRPFLLLGNHNVPEEDMITEELICIECLMRWTGRYPDGFRGLACPSCGILSGTTLEEFAFAILKDLEP